MAEETEDTIGEEVQTAGGDAPAEPATRLPPRRRRPPPDVPDPPGAPRGAPRRAPSRLARAARRPSSATRSAARAARAGRQAAARLPRQAEGAPRRRARRSARRPRPPTRPSTVPAGRRPGQGVVVSAKGDKTITVRIDVVRRHRRYRKILRSTIKLYAHDERNDAARGRHRAHRRVPADEPHQALAPDRRAGARAMIQNETRLQGRRQHRRPRDPLHPRDGRLAPPLRGRRRHHHGHRQAGQSAGVGQEGRGRQGRRRAHEEGVRARGRHLHRLRRERRGDHRRPEQPARHAHLRARWRASCATAGS